MAAQKAQPAFRLGPWLLILLFCSFATVCAVRADTEGFTPPHAIGACIPCDANCDSFTDLQDTTAFVDLLLDGSGCSPCAGDMDLSGVIDGRDAQLFIDCMLSPLGACCTGPDSCAVAVSSNCAGLWLGPGTACQAGICALGNLTAFRPQHGADYFPHTKTAVQEADEGDTVRGPGIRINAPGDADPAGEDDLIEILLERSSPRVTLALGRDHAALRIWSTRTKVAGSEIPFINDRTGSLPFAPGQVSLTLWVEWSAAEHGLGEIRLEPLEASFILDSLKFHTFRSIVLALGGENQPPSVPVDGNHGTFVVGISLYQRGYDVHLYDEDNVSASGTGAVYNEAVNAVANRLVDQISIFGYSHGGGSTHDLSERLNIDRPGIGVFEIMATSYVDSVENDSDFDTQQELRRPPASGYHANHYQVGSFTDFWLDGGPVPNSDPAPTGRNMEGTQGAEEVTHYLVDDYPEVRSFIELNLAQRVIP